MNDHHCFIQKSKIGRVDFLVDSLMNMFFWARTFVENICDNYIHLMFTIQNEFTFLNMGLISQNMFKMSFITFLIFLLMNI